MVFVQLKVLIELGYNGPTKEEKLQCEKHMLFEQLFAIHFSDMREKRQRPSKEKKVEKMKNTRKNNMEQETLRTATGEWEYKKKRLEFCTSNCFESESLHLTYVYDTSGICI